jgi:hypothetical protein
VKTQWPLLLSLILLATAASAMPLSVEIQRSTTVTSIELEVEANDTIESIKQQIETETGIPAADQILFFGDTELEDGRTLADYNILAGSSLTLYAPDEITDPGDGDDDIDGGEPGSEPGDDGEDDEDGEDGEDGDRDDIDTGLDPDLIDEPVYAISERIPGTSSRNAGTPEYPDLLESHIRTFLRTQTGGAQ